MKLTRKEFDAELEYQILMHFARQMLRMELITAEEYESLCIKYADQLKPKTGSLVARNVVLSGEFKQNKEPKPVAV